MKVLLLLQLTLPKGWKTSSLSVLEVSKNIFKVLRVVSNYMQVVRGQFHSLLVGLARKQQTSCQLQDLLVLFESVSEGFSSGFNMA